MVIRIEQYISTTNDTIIRIIENVVDVEMTFNGPEGSYDLTKSDGTTEKMDMGDDFKIDTYTNSGILLEPTGD